MDPKSIANLDPKLRETYERVMGNNAGGTGAPATPPADPAAAAPSTPIDAFSTGGPAAPASPPASSPTSQFVSVSPVSPPADAGLSAPLTPEAQLSPVVPSNPAASLTNAPASVYNSATSGISAGAGSPQLDMNGGAGLQPLASPAAAAQTAQGGNSLVKILYIFGGIIFFIVYIFFWIKIFNYQLPF